MTTIGDFMTDDHRRCDEQFVEAERLTAEQSWDEAVRRFGEFRDAILHHFRMEESVLFPAFEEATGSTMGPTGVMRFEHQQMREQFNGMEAALRSRDRDGYLGESETLLILMQQHNAKEEQILYPMTDRMLAGSRDGLLSRMQLLEAAP